ncbi:glycosyltransferase family 4 protein [Cellulomonas chengniuliangii]|uniref:Glycosyltransferase family 4 protein n=1 Tax=Cellulomonas chengniuliangii TaxID=2968084 RepID=A0ABY5KZD1_9CELL|nr:glycosyltransferase family 1 protein [Cellulomonas chengniuliangii]MCC2308734.1 glycosyltransferase family 4 protein [Cellulomonas chengniuliangii]UUI74515.1 glycosyltransferase family 4 protein [Cellulomonas chengniuliangii]
MKTRATSPLAAPTPLVVGVTVEQCWQRVPGGSASYIVQLSDALASRPDIQPVGLAARHGGEPPPADFTPTIPVRSLGLPRAVLYRAWNRVAAPRPEWTARDLDVVHATTWAIPPTRRPLVVTVHDVAFLRDPSHFTPRGVRYFRRSLARARDEADAIIVPSQATADDCLDVGIERDRLHVVPHGVHPPTTTSHDAEAFRRRHGLPARYVLWCGTHEPRKNLNGLLDAFERLSLTDDIHLVLVGPSGWGDTEAGAALSHPERVHRLGHLSTLDLQAAYAGATAFCFPSIWEGFGLPVLEAMSHGVPVVTSAGTSMAEIVGDAGILVDPRDLEAIAAALQRAVGGDAAALGVAALQRSRDFTWAHAAEQTVSAYRAALSRR